jgi:hypothetical protein
MAGLAGARRLAVVGENPYSLAREMAFLLSRTAGIG